MGCASSLRSRRPGGRSPTRRPLSSGPPGCGWVAGQAEELAARAAIDVDGFYTTHAPEPAPDDVLVLSFDAKGVVMRPDGPRAATAKAAASQKLVTRLSKGEKAQPETDGRG